MTSPNSCARPRLYIHYIQMQTQNTTGRLERYNDFVRVNSVDGVYSPEKGLEEL